MTPQEAIERLECYKNDEMVMNSLRSIDSRRVDELLELIDLCICAIRKQTAIPNDAVCGSCIYLDLNDKTSIGYKCVHPSRPFRYGENSCASRKYKNTKACKKWELSKEKPSI